MKVYRYEKPDKGGPFCTSDGALRSNPKFKFDDTFVSGCLSLQQLEDYFKHQSEILKDCKIHIYDIPKEEIIIRDKEVLFPNKYLF